MSSPTDASSRIVEARKQIALADEKLGSFDGELAEAVASSCRDVHDVLSKMLVIVETIELAAEEDDDGQ